MTQDDRQLLESWGFTEYKKIPVSKWLLPDTFHYKATNAAMFVFLLGIRYRAKSIGAPTGPATFGILAMPLFWRADKRKIDMNQYYTFDNENFSKNLEFSPLTRNAWIEALIENKKYNEALKKRIEELEIEKGINGEEEIEQNDVIDDVEESEDDEDDEE